MRFVLLFLKVYKNIFFFHMKEHFLLFQLGIMVYVQKNYHIKNDKVMKKNNLSLYELLIKNYGISTSTIRKLETRYLVNFRSLLINFRLKAENRHKILKKI